MISTSVIISFFISGFIAVFAPIILAIYAYKKYKIHLLPLVIGMAVFFIFQVITRIPLISILEAIFHLSQTIPKGLYLLGLAFTAGLFEETGRYLAFRFILKKHRAFKSALAFGIGHGGIESILLVGTAMINNIVMSLMINNGQLDKLLGPAVPTGQLETIKQALLDVTPLLGLAGGFERLLTLVLQIAFTFVIVNGFVLGKEKRYLGLAILLHMLVDLIAVILSSVGVSVMIIELILALMAALAFMYIQYSKKHIYRNTEN